MCTRGSTRTQRGGGRHGGPARGASWRCGQAHAWRLFVASSLEVAATATYRSREVQGHVVRGGAVGSELGTRSFAAQPTPGRAKDPRDGGWLRPGCAPDLHGLARDGRDPTAAPSTAPRVVTRTRATPSSTARAAVEKDAGKVVVDIGVDTFGVRRKHEVQLAPRVQVAAETGRDGRLWTPRARVVRGSMAAAGTAAQGRHERLDGSRRARCHHSTHCSPRRHVAHAVRAGRHVARACGAETGQEPLRHRTALGWGRGGTKLETSAGTEHSCNGRSTATSIRAR